MAVDQAATETDREVILGDTTVAVSLARGATATAAGTDALPPSWACRRRVQPSALASYSLRVRLVGMLLS